MREGAVAARASWLRARWSNYDACNGTTKSITLADYQRALTDRSEQTYQPSVLEKAQQRHEQDLESACPRCSRTAETARARPILAQAAFRTYIADNGFHLRMQHARSHGHSFVVRLRHLGSRSSRSRTAERSRSARSAQQDTQVFDEAWRIVRDKFYDRNLKGLDWEAVGNRHRADYENAKTDAERSAAINAMLAELGASHTHHYTRDETAYYELADIFSYKLRREIPKYFSGDKVAYSGIGMFTKRDRRQDLRQCGVPRIAGGQGRAPARRRARLRRRRAVRAGRFVPQQGRQDGRAQGPSRRERPADRRCRRAQADRARRTRSRMP